MNIAPVYKKMVKADPTMEKYGYIPLMAMCYIGHLQPESFCERVLSPSQTIIDCSDTHLSDENREKLLMLRMNRGFIETMRMRYAAKLRDRRFSVV